MQLSFWLAKHASEFPAFMALIQSELPMLQFRQPQVYAHFVRFCTASRWADEALQVGAGPLVVVTNTCASIREARVSGFFESNKNHNRVFYEELCVRKFERNVAVLRREIESLVLHELIHWARHHAGAPAKVAPVRAGGEAGNEFEWACYGMDMSSRWGLSPQCSAS